MFISALQYEVVFFDMMSMGGREEGDKSLNIRLAINIAIYS